MAQVAAYLCTLAHADGVGAAVGAAVVIVVLFTFIIVFIIEQVDAVCGRNGQYRAFQIQAVTGTAGIRIAFVEIFVFTGPCTAVHVVHTVGAVQRWRQAGMAGAAFADRAGVALKLDRGYIVIRVRHRIRPDRVGGTVAALACDAAVTQAVAVQRIVCLLYTSDAADDL